MSICFWFGDLSWGKRQLQFKKKIIFNLKYQFIKLKGIQEANIWKFFKYNMDNISIKKKKKKKREGSVSLSFEIHNTVVKKKIQVHTCLAETEGYETNFSFYPHRCTDLPHGSVCFYFLFVCFFK